MQAWLLGPRAEALPTEADPDSGAGDPQYARPQQQCQNGESEESHTQFLKALQNAVSTFVNRMKSNHVRGRSITNDSAVLSLFQSINGMHPQLLELLNQLDERRRASLRPLCCWAVGWAPPGAGRPLGFSGGKGGPNDGE